MLDRRVIGHDILMAYTCLVCFVCVVSASYGGTRFHVEINTSSLTGPFSIEFQFNDGRGIGDANNRASMSNFLFGGGSASGNPLMDGGARGSLSTTVTLTDTSFFNHFVEGFTPGSTLSFDVSLTTEVDPGETPDVFYFAVLDGNGVPIPTLGLGDGFLLVNIDSSSPEIQTFASDSSLTSLGIDAPTSQELTPVPGDLDGDSDVDQNDINILRRDLNKSVSQSTCGQPCDLDGDGKITALDARKLALLCTRPGCATK